MTTIHLCQIIPEHSNQGLRCRIYTERRRLPSFRWKTASNSLFNNTVLFLSYSYSYDHKNTGIKVYSSDINIDVYSSNQNRANHLLKVTSVSNNVYVDYIVLPLGGDKWQLKMYLSLNHSFKRFVQKHGLIQQWNKWNIYEWVSGYIYMHHFWFNRI